MGELMMRLTKKYALKLILLLVFSTNLSPASATELTYKTSFLSISYPNRYIRSKDKMLYLTEVHSESSGNAASFVLEKGLGQSFRFRSISQKNHYLAYQGEKIILRLAENNKVFQREVSFKLIPGLYNSGAFSFESVAKPGYFIRQLESKLFLHALEENETFRKDVTFRINNGFAY